MFKTIKGLVLFSLVLGLAFGSSLTQAQVTSIPIEIQLSNVCSQGTIIPLAVIFSAGFSNFAVTITGLSLGPGQSYGTEQELPFTPNQLTVQGLFGSTQFSAVFEDFMFNVAYNDPDVAGGCLQTTVSAETGRDDGGETQPTPPTGDKPLAQGQTFEQVLAALATMNIPVDIDGNQTSPKLGNVGDPMLLRSINGFSAQVIWVSAPGSLRSVITWDNPLVDLDLIVIGLPSCFQLTPPGVLAEFCDRFPYGPAGGLIFPVIIINWTGVNQAYVLSLSP